jgi:hexosaminidase
MLLEQHVNLDPSTLILVWINSSNSLAVAKAGYKLIQAPSDYFYLDCGAGGWLGNAADGNSWCDPFKTWQKAYSYDPLANLTSSAQKALVIGGESLLWTEQSGPENLDSIVWPRAAAAAEVFWTGETLPDSMGGGSRIEEGGEEALGRLHDVSFRMRQREVKTISLQPLWCALRPGKCDLV